MTQTRPNVLTRFAVLFLALAAGQAPAAAPDGGLTEPYVDGTYGFSLRLPEGWQVSQKREPEPLGTTLLTLVEPLTQRAGHQITLTHITTKQGVPIGEMLGRLVADVEFEHPKCEVLARQVQPIAGRPGGYLSATYFRPDEERLALQAVVEVAPGNHFLFRYQGPASQRMRVEPLFQQMLASLEFLFERIDQAALDRAFEAGRSWLRTLSANRLQEACAATQYLRFEIDGRPVGFTAITAGPETKYRGRRTLAGVEIFEESWVFDPQGQARRLQSRMFVTGDLSSEQWTTSATTWLPPEKDRPERLENAYQEGLRERNVLLTSQTSSLAEPLKENPPLEVPETYITRPLVRLLPRLIGRLDEPRQIAFVEFNHDRAGLIMRVVDVKGTADLPGGREHEKAFRIDVREGLVASPSVFYLDAEGRILLAQSGKLTLRRAEAAELERSFGERIAEVDRAMARLEQQYQQYERRFLRRRE